MNGADPEGLEIVLTGSNADKARLTAQFLVAWYSGSKHARKMITKLKNDKRKYTFHLTEDRNESNRFSGDIWIGKRNSATLQSQSPRGVGFLPGVMGQILLAIGANTPGEAPGSARIEATRKGNFARRSLTETFLHEIGHVLFNLADSEDPRMPKGNRMKNVMSSEWPYQMELGLPLRINY